MASRVSHLKAGILSLCGIGAVNLLHFLPHAPTMMDGIDGFVAKLLSIPLREAGIVL